MIIWKTKNFEAVETWPLRGEEPSQKVLLWGSAGKLSVAQPQRGPRNLVL